MPLAEQSLEDAIKSSEFDEAHAKDILSQIANGLTELRHIVHRDLKPANILLHNGKWKIADFGISKIADQVTANTTHKLALTQPYASPERWNEETATSASDVYSLGCIAYALLSGRPPFDGPDREDYKRQHCRETPPSLTLKDKSLSVLVLGMLSKSPDARPSVEAVKKLKTNVTDSEELPPSFSMLADAGLSVADSKANDEVDKMKRSAAKKSRETITADGYAQLEAIA